MKYLKRFCEWEKKQMKNPETVLAVWVALGVVLGIGMDNIGAGIAIGVAIGVAMYATKKKTEKESAVDESEVHISEDSK